ncbi:MAG: hypothetical protein WC220_07065 [Pedobacter sp.]|jgi:hypothetical protein
MKSSKKVTKSGVPKKKPGTDPDKKKTLLSDPNEPIRPIIDDEEDFDLQLDDDIPAFDDFDDDDDDDF